METGLQKSLMVLQALGRVDERKRVHGCAEELIEGL